MLLMLGRYSDTTVRCLFAVLAGANSVRDVKAAIGVASTSTVHHHLRVLRSAGLVEWEPGLQRTLRATVTEVNRGAA